MRTHSRHVSREPRAPGTPGPRSICKTSPPLPPHTKQTRTTTPVRGGFNYRCLQLPFWQSWIQYTRCRRSFCHNTNCVERAIQYNRAFYRDKTCSPIRESLEIKKRYIQPPPMTWKVGAILCWVSAQPNALSSLTWAVPPSDFQLHQSQDPALIICYLQRTLLTVFQGHVNSSHCSGRWMQRTWRWSRTVCR